MRKDIYFPIKKWKKFSNFVFLLFFYFSLDVIAMMFLFVIAGVQNRPAAIRWFSIAAFATLLLPTIINVNADWKYTREGLFVKKFFFIYKWIKIPSQQIQKIKRIPYPAYMRGPTWIVKVNGLPIWYSLISFLHGQGFSPGVLISDKNKDYERLVKIVKYNAGKNEQIWDPEAYVQQLEGDFLNQVIFIMDYLQIGFNVGIVTAILPPVIEHEGQIWHWDQPGYNDKLISLIESVVLVASLDEEKKFFQIVLDNNATLTIDWNELPPYTHPNTDILHMHIHGDWAIF